MERALLIPGLGDDTEALQPTVAHMKEHFGWETSVEPFGWMRTRDEYDDRMRWLE